MDADGLLVIDAATGSGSGTIVRQSVAYAALTGRAIRVVNARARRPQPGLRHQHLRTVEAICELTGGTLEGAALGAREFVFRPGPGTGATSFSWDVGSAGSVTALAIALLPVLAFRSGRGEVTLHGGLFQDFAPSEFHLEHVLVPLIARMGVHATVRMVRPGYVPAGAGIIQLTVEPVGRELVPLHLVEIGAVERVWGIALSSHLAERRVSARMAQAAREVLETAGYAVDIDERDDTAAPQAGAALALFADRRGGARLGADGAGAPHRRAERIGTRVAHQLLAEIDSGATVDRFAADQLVPFAALAAGESRIRIRETTDHVTTGAWLARQFLDAAVDVDPPFLTVRGAGHPPPSAPSPPPGRR